MRQVDNPEMQDEKDEWVITVAYVAHDFSDGLDDLPTEVSGFPIEHEFWSYEELTEKAFEDARDDKIAEIFNTCVRDALNSRNVLQNARDKAMEIFNTAISN